MKSILAILFLFITSCFCGCNLRSTQSFKNTNELHWHGDKVKVVVSKNGFNASVTQSPPLEFTEASAAELIAILGDKDIAYTTPWRKGTVSIIGVLVNSGQWNLVIEQQKYSLTSGHCYLFRKEDGVITKLQIGASKSKKAALRLKGGAASRLKGLKGAKRG